MARQRLVRSALACLTLSLVLIAAACGPGASTPQPTLPGGKATISGKVWHDLCAVAGGEGGTAAQPSAGCVPGKAWKYQANGLLEAGEPGIAGVLVQLGAGRCPATGLRTARTDSSGVYAFVDLPAGNYCVSVDALSKENEFLLPGMWTSPAAAVASSVSSYTLSLRDGEERSEINFGWDYQFLPEAGPGRPTAVPTPPPCTDLASFDSDVTIPDWTAVAPGQTFVKTWRLKNIGSCTWTPSYHLIFASGASMGGAVALPLPRSVAPGELVDLSITLTAPSEPGRYEGRWQLRNQRGQAFGIVESADGTFSVRIAVGGTPGPTAATPAPTGATPGVTPVPPTATPIAVLNWRGQYFDNPTLAGSPVLERDDPAVSFYWGDAAPAPALPADRFSVRWTRTTSFSQGTYTFYAHSDDGLRFWLDGELLLDQWHDASGKTYTTTKTLSAGDHTVRIEYYENGGLAHVGFWWETGRSFSEWRGEYYANIALAAVPVVVRNDAAIDFDWNTGAPDPAVPSDGFSARWTRSLNFEGGIYRFHAWVDDALRIWVDDNLVLDDWREGSRRELEAQWSIVSGRHTVRVEYFERYGAALVQVTWDRVTPFPDWMGQYWTNPDLEGAPALTQNEGAVDFDWGLGAPAAGLPSDNFSARWTRAASFEAGTYRFHVKADDGARLYVDDKLIIDGWRGFAGQELTADVLVAKGSHNLRVEFNEIGGEATIRFWYEKLP